MAYFEGMVAEARLNEFDRAIDKIQSQLEEASDGEGISQEIKPEGVERPSIIEQLEDSTFHLLGQLSMIPPTADMAEGSPALDLTNRAATSFFNAVGVLNRGMEVGVLPATQDDQLRIDQINGRASMLKKKVDSARGGE